MTATIDFDRAANKSVVIAKLKDTFNLDINESNLRLMSAGGQYLGDDCTVERYINSQRHTGEYRIMLSHPSFVKHHR